MLKLLQTNPQIEALTKLLETVMQLRIDVKQPQEDSFKNIVNQLKARKEPQVKARASPLVSINIKELYGVRKKLEGFQGKSIEDITIKFSFVNKKDQGVQTAEIWSFRNVKYSKASSVVRQEDNRKLQLLFEDVIDTLFKLPMWVDYWNNQDNRKIAKQSSILDFGIVYGQQGAISNFPFDYKISKQHKLLGMSLSLTVMYARKLSFLNTSSPTSKKETDRAVTLHKLSGDSRRTRRCSVYEYYDEELDITFVSSEGELDLNDNSMSEVTFQVQEDEESDEEYEMIIESAEETRKKQFLEKLTKFSKMADEVDNEYF